MFTIRKLVTVLTLICIIHQTLACYVIETLSKKDALEIASNFSLSIADEVEKPEAASDIILKGSSNIIECLGLENELQKIHISWLNGTADENITIATNETHQLIGRNITVQSLDQDFFAKKFIPLNESEVAFGVMISPSRKYIVRVEAENRKTVLIGFFITNQRPTCNTNSAFCIFLVIATIGVTSYITYKFQKKGEEEDEDTVEITVDDDVDDAEKKLKNKNLANEDKKDTNENMVLILDETKDNNNEKSNYQKNITQSNKLELETKKAEDNPKLIASV